MSAYDLILGELGLFANDYDGDTYRLDVLGEDMTLGNPVAAAEVVASLMRDGDLTRTNRFGNREASFRVQVTAADPVGLADGLNRLAAELDKPNTLTWRVPYGADTVFEVVRSWPEWLFDDLDELRIIRTFRIVLECLPFPRSVDPVTINWTGTGTELDPLTSAAGWTVVSGSATITAGVISTASTVTLEKSVALDEYLWLKVTGDGLIASDSENELLDVMVDGVEVSFATIRKERVDTSAHFHTIPTDAWRGQTATVRFTLTRAAGTVARITEFWSRTYPGPASVAGDTFPKGIGVIDVVGSARAPATVSFTAPAGGAFVYTAPDPNAAIRGRGAGEMVFASFEVTDPLGDEVAVGSQLMWFPEGTHAANIGVTAPQPVALHPGGVWPTQASGVISSPAGVQWAYPVDSQAATAFFATSGAKAIVSPSASLPEGYHAAADHYEALSLHPGRCGFAVLDQFGDPVAATVTYHPCWWHHAGQ